jgi:cation:H+ antiporter
VSQAILGNLVLAALTGIPNVIGAVRLAQRRRGSAVVSEALNSNTFNLLAGLVVPALLLGLGAVSRIGVVSAVWLLGMTVLASGLTYFRGSLRRAEGIAVIASYLIFCGLVVAS